MNAGTAYCKFIIIECGVHLNLPVLLKYEYNFLALSLLNHLCMKLSLARSPENRNISNCSQDEPELEGNFPVKKQRGNLQND